jgi:hypothetical protein
MGLSLTDIYNFYIILYYIILYSSSEVHKELWDPISDMSIPVATVTTGRVCNYNGDEEWQSQIQRI